VFGYQSSNLSQWVAEKTGGGIAAADVSTVSIKDLRKGGPERVTSLLSKLERGSICVVDAVSYRDLGVFILGLLNAEEQGKRFLDVRISYDVIHEVIISSMYRFFSAHMLFNQRCSPAR
jgi:hypothetical protein